MIGNRRSVLSKRVENTLSGLLIVIAAAMAWRFLLPQRRFEGTSSTDNRG